MTNLAEELAAATYSLQLALKSCGNDVCRRRATEERERKRGKMREGEDKVYEEQLLWEEEKGKRRGRRSERERLNDRKRTGPDIERRR